MFQIPQTILQYEAKQKSTICVDWFQIYGSIKKKIANDLLAFAKDNFEFLEFGEQKELILKHTGKGGGNYKHNFDVYLFGEHVANLLCYPSDSSIQEMNMPINACSIKIENHLLYKSEWLIIFDFICQCLQITINNITRLDIAIDNTQNVKEFMNFYIKSNEVKKAGKTPKEHEKGGVSAVRFDENNGFCSFRIGSSSSDKYISIYNKSSEIQSFSQKKYIIDFWKENNIDTEKVIYRTELRLNSKSIQNIENFNIDLLDNANYLASIFKTHTKNFFEFYYNCDKNSSRCPRIELINYDDLGGKLLEKTKKAPPKDIYKAKLTLHLLYKMIFQNLLSFEKYEQQIKDICLKLKNDFDLEQWLQINVEKWRKKYKPDPYNLIKIYIQNECTRLNTDLYTLNYKKDMLEIDYETCKNYGLVLNFRYFVQIWNKITLN